MMDTLEERLRMIAELPRRAADLVKAEQEWERAKARARDLGIPEEAITAALRLVEKAAGR